MSAGATAKMLANKQVLVKKDGKIIGPTMFLTRMARKDYIRFDSLLVDDIDTMPTSPEISHNINLSNTIIGGVNLALCDDGTNGCIKENSMRLLSYNNDGKYVSIDTVSDQQLTGAQLCTGVSDENPIKGGLN